MQIKLTKNKVTVVDDNLSSQILKNKYCTIVCGDKHYAVTNIKGKTVYLHRLIMKAPAGTVVDHINGDTLDNRKSNLRLCLHKENIRNQRNHPDKWQKYRGVDFMKVKNKYRARITVDKKEIHLGVFDTAIEASKVYSKAAKYYFGNFVKICS